MATFAGRRMDQAGNAMPAYDLSFLEALEPALGDIAKHGIKVAVNAGVCDTKGLFDVVSRMVQAKRLDLKVTVPTLCFPLVSVLIGFIGSLRHW